MTPADRDRLTRLLASFDEAGLVALANVGLVRRARKDLDAGGVTHEETDHAVIVRGLGWAVTMPPDGPTKATDTTAATGVTRQVLAATMYLRDTWAATTEASTGPPPGEALAEALLAVSLDDLVKWAGKTAVKDALAALTPPPAVEVEVGAALAIRLVSHDVEARLLPGGTRPAQLLDAVLTTAPKAQHTRWVLVAVLAFQASRGKVIERREAASTADAPAGSPVSRAQVLTAARELFAAMVGGGIAHVSERTSQRLFTLSVSATALLLPRLARLVRAVADEVDLALARHAAADPARLFARLYTADALAQSLQAAGEPPPLRLAGRPRTEYDAAPDLVLVGVGAFPWESASGFEGVTALFWDMENKRFLTWTASRPAATPGRFSSDASYRSEVLWRCGPAEQLCRSLVALRGGRLNPAGRLSTSKDSRAEAIEPTDPARIDFGGRAFADWAALAAYAAGTFPLGLVEEQPLDRIVVLKPAGWGERVFDESRQCLRWDVRDAAGSEAELTVPWVGVNEPAVEFLEAVNPDRDRLTHVVARVGFARGGLTLEPLALLGAGTPNGGHRVLCPGFDRGRIVSRNAALLERLRAKFGRDRVPTTLGGDDDAPEAGPDAPGAVGDRLREWEAVLLGVAEAGTRRGATGGERRTELLGFFRRVGFTELGDPWADGETVTPDALLRAGYLAALHRDALRAGVGSVTL
ncbi:MAG TPA: hypothetical protein VD866_20400 [Urbifossiella sp.]|nr:hypothetical protein [Urbifossiella sp.]